MPSITVVGILLIQLVHTSTFSVLRSCSSSKNHEPGTSKPEPNLNTNLEARTQKCERHLFLSSSHLSRRSNVVGVRLDGIERYACDVRVAICRVVERCGDITDGIHDGANPPVEPRSPAK